MYNACGSRVGSTGSVGLYACVSTGAGVILCAGATSCDKLKHKNLNNIYFNISFDVRLPKNM